MLDRTEVVKYPSHVNSYSTSKQAFPTFWLPWTSSSDYLTETYFVSSVLFFAFLFFFTRKVKQFLHFMSTRHIQYIFIIYAIIMYMQRALWTPLGSPASKHKAMLIEMLVEQSVCFTSMTHLWLPMKGNYFTACGIMLWKLQTFQHACQASRTYATEKQPTIGHSQILMEKII